MSKYRDLLERCETLVIFKSLKEDEVVHALLETLAAAEDECSDSVSWYCEFVSLLYKHGDNLTKYILKLVLENENLYMLRRGSGEQTGELLDECLANELFLLEELAEISCEELTDSLDFDGFLPRYNTEKADFSKIYADRIHNIAKYGYGIYSQYHVFVIDNGKIVPVEYPDSISLSQLSGYERERGEVIDNTLALLAGKPANNVLLYGDCGTGKSSTVKAIANDYAKEGLRLIELKKKQLHEIPAIVEQISRNPLKFIIFIDDLSFTEDDDDFAALKAILEGSVSSTAANLCIYATSNRRHLVRETFSSREVMKSTAATLCRSFSHSPTASDSLLHTSSPTRSYISPLSRALQSSMTSKRRSRKSNSALKRSHSLAQAVRLALRSSLSSI